MKTVSEIIKETIALNIMISDDYDAVATISVYQEPSQAQKDINDNDPPGPWPWWVSSFSYTDGPFNSEAAALAAVWEFLKQA